MCDTSNKKRKQFSYLAILGVDCLVLWVLSFLLRRIGVHIVKDLTWHAEPRRVKLLVAQNFNPIMDPGQDALV